MAANLGDIAANLGDMGYNLGDGTIRRGDAPVIRGEVVYIVCYCDKDDDDYYCCCYSWYRFCFLVYDYFLGKASSSTS